MALLVVCCNLSLSSAATPVPTCSLNQSNMVSAITQLPLCARVGIMKDNISAWQQQFYHWTNYVPTTVWKNAEEGILAHFPKDFPERPVFVVSQTELDWGQGIEAVMKGELDIFLANIWILRARLQMVDFSQPIISE